MIKSAISLKGFDVRSASPMEYLADQRALLKQRVEKTAIEMSQNSNFNKWSEGAVFKDPNGTPTVFWHWTERSFDRFRTNHGEASYYAFGAHLGSFESATARSRTREPNVSPLSKAAHVDRMIPLVIKAKSPLLMSEPRTGRWGVDDVMLQIFEMAQRGEIAISDDLIDEYAQDRLIIRGEDWFDVDLHAQAEMLKHFLTHTLHVDCIVYENQFEKGGNSILVWDPFLIKSAIANKGTFNELSSNIYD